MIKTIVHTGSYFLDVGTCNETILVTSKEIRHVTSGSSVTTSTVSTVIVSHHQLSIRKFFRKVAGFWLFVIVSSRYINPRNRFTRSLNE